MSGVVRPVVTWSSAVVTPSVPMLAGVMPRHPPELAGQLDGRGLAVGAGDRDDRLGKGREEFGGEPGEGAPRLVGGDVDRALDLGLRAATTTATAPATTASGMKSSPLNRAPRNAPNTVPGATLRWSIAKPVTGAVSPLPVSAPSFISRCRGSPAATQRHQIGDVDVAARVGHDAEQRPGALDRRGRRPARRSRRRW